MENSMVRQRYTRRPMPSRRRRNVTRAGRGSLRQIIARQLIICVILLIMIGIVKSINISATNFVTDNVKYILSYNIELKNVFSYLEKSVIDIRRSIAPTTEGNTASEDNPTLTENPTSSAAPTSSTAPTSRMTPTSTATPVIDLIAGTDTNVASESDIATLSSEISETEDTTSLDIITVEATSSIDDESAKDGIYSEEASTKPETSVLAASNDNIPLHSSGMIAPVVGTLSSVYGEKSDLITGAVKMHNGIDINVKKGSIIKAALDGKITEAGSSPNYGSYIRIRHADGLQTIYANCSSLIAQEGDIVKQGDVIANIGNIGASVGVHLHFEVWKDGNTTDPLEYISVPAG